MIYWSYTRERHCATKHKMQILLKQMMIVQKIPSYLSTIFSVFPQFLNVNVGDQDDINQVLETGKYFKACWSLRSNQSHIASVAARYRCFGTIVQFQFLKIADNIQASIWQLLHN